MPEGWSCNACGDRIQPDQSGAWSHFCMPGARDAAIWTASGTPSGTNVTMWPTGAVFWDADRERLARIEEKLDRLLERLDGR